MCTYLVSLIRSNFSAIHLCVLLKLMMNYSTAKRFFSPLCRPRLMRFLNLLLWSVFITFNGTIFSTHVLRVQSVARVYLYFSTKFSDVVFFFFFLTMKCTTRDSFAVRIPLFSTLRAKVPLNKLKSTFSRKIITITIIL